MAKRLLPLVVLIALAALAAPVQADPACDPYPSCPLTDGFDTDDDGWSGVDGTATAWASSQTFGVVFQSSADGVLTAYDSITQLGGNIVKSVWLDPGSYVVNWRAATDVSWLDPFAGGTVIVSARLPGGGDYQTLGEFDPGRNQENFASWQTGEFVVDEAGMATVMIQWLLPQGHTIYFDHIIIGRITEPVSGPFTPNPPTYTPGPTQPPQATPVPTQAVGPCIAEPAEDIVPASQRWAYLNDRGIAYDLKNWGRTSAQVDQTQQVNLYQSLSGAIRLPYSPSGDVMGRPALVFTMTAPVSPTTAYLLSYAMADSLLSGQTAYVEVWALSGGTWASVGDTAINSRTWTPIVYTMTAGSGINAIAWAARRSDTPASAYVFLDRLYVYGHPDLMIRCDGTFPSVTVGAARSGMSGVPYNPAGDAGSDATIIYPANKACPPDTLDVPNNFWGPLIAQLTLWLDRMTANYPSHAPSSMTSTASSLATSPALSYVSVVMAIVDFSPFLYGVGIVLALEGVRALWSVWMLIKRTTPFLGGG